MTEALEPDVSFVGRLPADEPAARRIADVLAETFDAEEVVVGAVEEADGSWAVLLHFRVPPNEAAVRALVALASDAAHANTLTFSPVAGRDWVAASLAGLPPVAAGRFLIHGAHDRAKVRANQIAIEIEAALAFGTGHHGTTRGCLLALDALLKAQAPRRVLDVGTGSGVLAMAAARALQRRILASDIDQSALRVARANARLNRVGGLVAFVHAAGVARRTVQRDAPYDLILANILLAPLTRMAAAISRLAAPGGYVVLSGLLNAQAPTALAHYRAQGLVFVREIALEGWSSLILRRP